MPPLPVGKGRAVVRAKAVAKVVAKAAPPVKAALRVPLPARAKRC